MSDVLSGERDFSSLSLKDLLDARDLFHPFLANKPNVVATAVGRYLIRHGDPWPAATTSTSETSVRDRPKEKRTLTNSEVRDYSWPCILVFVSQWLPEYAFGPRQVYSGSAMIPKTVYMPDGRRVPVCIVEAEMQEETRPRVTDWIYPKNLIGGGYPVISDVQNQEHVSTIGCLVTDGHRVYALTSRHVSGDAGTPVYSLLNDEKIRIGVASPRQLTRKPFEEVYSGWPGKRIYVNLDVGLIDIDDKTRWTAQVYGIGEMGRLADLSIDNITLRLIGCPVRAYGCASKQMAGEIKALFYRYKETGGFEYVADFLIGGREKEPLPTRHGDSGTVWLLETTEGVKADAHVVLRPIAVQWGGHEFASDAGPNRLAYALATCLSTACNLLEVDVIRDWNIGQVPYWGAVGHYSIATLAATVVRNETLHDFLDANLERISFRRDNLKKNALSGLSKKPFVPLADVPDLVWKPGANRPYNRSQVENASHYADMDKPDDNGRSLIDRLAEDPDRATDIAFWLSHYDAVGDKSRGYLPFRVWQFYVAMVELVQQGDAVGFLTIAGALSHYIGDACQPLHVSYMHDGDPDDLVTEEYYDKKRDEWRERDVPRAKGIHMAYENAMVDHHWMTLFDEVQEALNQANKPALLKSGRGAARETVRLLIETYTNLPPAKLIKTYNRAREEELQPKEIAQALWAKHGKATIENVTNGCLLLARLWDSAWSAGNGDANIGNSGLLDDLEIRSRYRDKTFVPAMDLATLASVLK